MSKPKRKPMRWRKARNPDKGGRWDTPLNRAIWNREHFGEDELVRGGEVLAVVRICPPIKWKIAGGPWEDASTADDAKAAAMAAVRMLDKKREEATS